MADQQAQDTLRQSHQVAQSALQSAHAVVSKGAQQAMQPPQAHPEIMGALQQLMQGQQAQGQGGQPGQGGPGGGLPDPNDLVQQDPAMAAAYADGILHALSQMVMASGMPQGPSMPAQPPNVGGENTGY